MGEEQMYPASMTKIMTTILAIENLKDLNQEITITNDMVADLYVQDAMQAGFQPNETVKAIDLLYGVMLPSGAECCVALADTVAGSVSDFVTLMNEKAEKLGMTGTHFSSISGSAQGRSLQHSKRHCAVARYAIKMTLSVRSLKVHIILHQEQIFIRMESHFTVRCLRICWILL